MPPPKSAEAPLQGLEGLVAEFFAGSGVLCRGASAVLFVDGIRGHVAHRFHGWRATAATLLPSGCIVRKYSNVSFLFLSSRDTDASARTRTTRNTRRTQFQSDTMLSRDGIAGKSRYIVRLPVVVRWWCVGGPMVVPTSRSRLAKERGYQAARPFRVLWRLLESRVELSNQVDELYRGHDRDHRCR